MANTFNRNNAQQQERTPAGAYVNNLCILPKGEEDTSKAINLGLNKAVLPLVGEENALHKRITDVAIANGGEIEIVFSRRLKDRLKDHINTHVSDLPMRLQG